MEKQRYITIMEWMQGLGIKGNELLVYALIYGFSQDGKSHYKGSASYICQWLGLSENSAYSILSRLEEKGLIRKFIVFREGVKYCEYTASTRPKKVGGGNPRKLGQNPPRKLGQTPQESWDNNTIGNTTIEIKDLNFPSLKSTQNKYGEQ